MTLADFEKLVGRRFIDRRPFSSGPLESIGADRVFAVIRSTEMEPELIMRQFCETGTYSSPHATYTLETPPVSDECQPPATRIVNNDSQYGFEFNQIERLLEGQ